MANTELLHWAVTHGRSFLGLGPLYRPTVTRKDSTQFVPIATPPKQELVSLETTKMIVTAVTPGSGLALEGSKMTLTRVATKLPGEIMATSTLKRWDTSWSNRFGRTQNKPSKGLKMKKLLILVKKRFKCESRIRDL